MTQVRTLEQLQLNFWPRQSYKPASDFPFGYSLRTRANCNFFTFSFITRILPYIYLPSFGVRNINLCPKHYVPFLDEERNQWLTFQQPLLPSVVSHNPSKIIQICLFGAQETFIFIIIDVENFVEASIIFFPNLS